MTFSEKFRASPTRMPAVWAIPSTISECGTIGNSGERSCRCSSARETFLTAVADVRGVNSVNLSIQIQRIGRGEPCVRPFVSAVGVNLVFTLCGLGNQAEGEDKLRPYVYVSANQRGANTRFAPTSRRLQ